MSRILFAWELGANYGHLSRQLPIAEQLRQQGHTIFFVSRDTAVAAQLLTPCRFPFTQAPFDATGRRLPQPPINYAEMLIAAGYADPAVLSGLVHSWLSLIQLFKPDVMVVDHAPTALFVAHLTGLPAIPIGTGFEIPPNCRPLPTIRPWETIADSRLHRAEEFVLERLNTLAASLGGRPLNRIPQLFQGTGKLLATFAELDHYGVRTGEAYTAPLFSKASGQLMTWSHPDKPHIFAYLQPGIPEFERLLNALSKLHAEVIVVALGSQPSRIMQVAKPGLRKVTRLIQMDQLLKSATLAVTTGGTGTVSQCLLAGVPLLVVPQNVEQYLMGHRVEALGAGLTVRHDRREEDFAALLTRLLHDSGFQQHAAAFANQYAGVSPEQTVHQAVLLINKVLQKEGI